LNDRTQAGSAEIEKGVIELIQHRRLIQDDIRGVDEPLNERDDNGLGIRVNARYYMHIFDRKLGTSKQRQQQTHIDHPVQYFFAMKYLESTTLATDTQFSSKIREQLSWDYAHFQMYPMAKNKVMVRLENNFDKFELEGVGLPKNEPNAQVRFVDLNQFASNLYLEANPKSQMTPSFVIKELSLSGNQLAQDNEAYKVKNRWIGDDDKTRPKSETPKDRNGMQGIALEPQRIRVFEISYGQKTSGT